jgi:hypothetical protein
MTIFFNAGAYAYNRCASAQAVAAPAGELSPSSVNAAAAADLVVIPSPPVVGSYCLFQQFCNCRRCSCFWWGLVTHHLLYIQCFCQAVTPGWVANDSDACLKCWSRKHPATDITVAFDHRVSRGPRPWATGAWHMLCCLVCVAGRAAVQLQ